MPLSHLPRTITPVATRICHSTCHSDVTTAHRVICLHAVNHLGAIMPPTSPSARPIESPHAGPHNPSIPGVGTPQCAFSAVVHITEHSNPRTGLKKCESLFTRCARTTRVAHTTCPLPAVGSILSTIGKPSQLRNHNDIGGRTTQIPPREAQVIELVRDTKNTIIESLNVHYIPALH